MNIGAIAANLRLGEDGIWYSRQDEAISYPADGNDSCFTLEDQSFWFRHRNRCIASVVRSFPPAGTIFDIGGGNGFVARGLNDAGFDVAVVEPGPAGASNAKQRGIETVICATTDTAGFAPSSLPAIGLFDVIEHVADDGGFLRSMRVLLVSGGLLYATVPAYSFLWSKEDDDAGHMRRYRLQEISDALRTARFEIEFASYIFRPLPLPILLLRSIPYRLRLAKKRGAAEIVRDHVPASAWVARAIDAVFDPEIRRLDARRAMAFGGSCLIAARA
jgi:SAM-dependent methyltransferase